MANKQTVSELYLSLGLDFSQLDRDFIDADKTVKANVARLKAEKNRVRIQMDIDTKNLGPAATLTDKLRVQESALTQEMRLQQQVVALANAEYAKMIQEKGAAAASSSTLHTSLLREQRTMAEIKNQLQTTAGKQQGGLSNMFTGVVDAIKGGGGLKGAIAIVGESFTSMAGISVGAIARIGGAVGVVTAAVKGMFDAAVYAADAGEKVYKLSQRMHITTEEAGKLNSILQLGGVDANAFTTTMMRLEKSVLGVGSGGSQAAETLSKFGVSLTDESGRLLPMNQQLEKLAEGYRNAAKSGEEETFMAQVLGARGQELIPIIQNYTEHVADMSKVHAIGPKDIEGAHELTRGLSVLDVQWKSIKVGIADAFVPLVNKFVPLAIGGFNLIIDAVKTFKDILSSLKDDAQLVGNMFSNFKDTPLSQLYEKSKKQLEEQKKAEAEAAKAKADAAKANSDLTGALSQQEQKDQENALKETKRRVAETRQARADAAEQTFKATHSALANEMLDIEKRAQELKAKGVEEVYITQYTEAAKAKAIEDFNNNTLAKINETYETSLQTRLEAIEREKKAWQQKGVDEVAATKWAEEQKLSAVRNAALEAIKSDRKRLEEVRDAMKQGEQIGYSTDANGNKTPIYSKGGGGMQQLTQRWIAEERAKLGINPGDTFSPELMQAYQEANKYMQGQLIPGLESKVPLGGTGATKVINNTPTINVSIDRPFVKDQDLIRLLGDEVSDDIVQQLKLRFGGGDNGY